jgi:hypothetical protein
MAFHKTSGMNYLCPHMMTVLSRVIYPALGGTKHMVFYIQRTRPLMLYLFKLNCCSVFYMKLSSKRQLNNASP